MRDMGLGRWCVINIRQRDRARDMTKQMPAKIVDIVDETYLQEHRYLRKDPMKGTGLAIR